MQREKSSDAMELNLWSLTCGMGLRRKKKSAEFSRAAVLIFVEFTNA